MKNILIILSLLFSTTLFAQEIKVIQVNAEWNNANTRLDLENLTGCVYQFGWLKHQPQSVQDELLSVPVVLILKNEVIVKKYQAGISLKLKTPLEEIQQEINAIKED